MFFSQDWRERVKAENPDAGFGEIGKLLGARWKELSEEEKKVCIMLALVLVAVCVLMVCVALHRASCERQGPCRARKEGLRCTCFLSVASHMLLPSHPFNFRLVDPCVHTLLPRSMLPSRTTNTYQYVSQNKKVDSGSGDEDDDE